MDKVKLEQMIPVIAQKYNFRFELIEKDYYLTLILNDVGSLLSDKLVFKGGTLLNKIHLNYHRLSEDLDFTYFGKEDLSSRSQRSKAITPVRENMPGFLKKLGLKSAKPEGEGFNNSTQYVFKITYPSVITDREGEIKFEVSLRQAPLDKPVRNTIKHFYQDPFTGEDLIPKNKVLSLSLEEAVAEKLKAAMTRKDVAIRDFYDLWYIAESGFDFKGRKFTRLFKRKMTDEGHKGGFRRNFGLSADKIALLRRQVETDLMPVVRAGEEFDLDAVFDRFNKGLPAPRGGSTQGTVPRKG